MVQTYVNGTLTSELIKPIQNEYVVSVCFSCGHGSFGKARYHARDKTYMVPAHHLIVTGKTLVATVLYRPGEIGRFFFVFVPPQPSVRVPK